MNINQPNIFPIAVGLTFLLIILTVFVIFLAIAFFRKANENRQLYEQILATNKGLEQLVDARTKELRLAGTAISESIDYASRLQRNLLPPKHQLEDHLGEGEVAVIWQPKDVVDGDFHWFGQIGTQHVMVAMDCTGHGVPGAFMTLIAHSALEQIRSSQNTLAEMGESNITAASILHMLHDSVYQMLTQSQLNRNQNGLDASLIILSHDRKTLNFCRRTYGYLHANP